MKKFTAFVIILSLLLGGGFYFFKTEKVESKSSSISEKVAEKNDTQNQSLRTEETSALVGNVVNSADGIARFVKVNKEESGNFSFVVDELMDGEMTIYYNEIFLPNISELSKGDPLSINTSLLDNGKIVLNSIRKVTKEDYKKLDGNDVVSVSDRKATFISRSDEYVMFKENGEFTEYSYNKDIKDKIFKLNSGVEILVKFFIYEDGSQSVYDIGQ